MLITIKDLKNFELPQSAADVRDASTYVEDVKEAFLNPTIAQGHTLPWSKTQENIRFRPGEVSLFIGVNGHGKSMLTSQVMLDFLFQGATVCIASFEMKPSATLRRMTRQALGFANPTEQFIEQFHGWLQGKLWLYDQQGTVNPNELLKVIAYCASKGIEHFVVDSLMKCVKNEDDYNGQKEFVDKVTAMARDFGIHIHLIHHSRKLADETQVPGKYDSKGSGSITDQVDQCFSIWRNKKKEQRVARGEEDDGVDALLVCDKNRHGEWEGRIGLFFDSEGQFYGETERWRANYTDRIDKQCLALPQSLTNVVNFSAKSK
jgi:twinkle protein